MGTYLGQNFLKNPEVVRDIITASQIINDDTVVEIGPGGGVLTQALLDAGAKVIAIEKDSKLVTLLNKQFATQILNGQLKIICGDILEFDVKSLKLKVKSFKIVANIPYYITGEILRKFLTAENLPERIVLMVQKEVAERICDSKESLLSLSVKAYGSPSIVRYVSRTDFDPAPDVDSAVLLIENISKNFFIENKIDETKFFKLLHQGFAHKRKVLGNNIKNIPAEYGEYKSKRAQELNLDTWRNLYLAIESSNAR